MHPNKNTTIALTLLVLVLMPILAYSVVLLRAQTTVSIVGYGRPVTIEATFDTTPGDAISPHLYVVVSFCCYLMIPAYWIYP